MDPIKEALTFDDVTLVPKYSEVLPSNVDTTVKLSKNLFLKIPILSSAMDTVTESKMAISIAKAGGIGVIHRNLDIKKQIYEIKKVKAKRTKTVSKKQAYKPWVVQVGAFGKYENANRLKKQLQGSGFQIDIQKINSNGKRLHTVRIIRFETKNQADKIGRSLKSKFGLDFRIINSPK